MRIKQQQLMETAQPQAFRDIQDHALQGRCRQRNGSRQAEMLIAFAVRNRRQQPHPRIGLQLFERQGHRSLPDQRIGHDRQMRSMLFDRADRQNDQRAFLGKFLNLLAGQPWQESLLPGCSFVSCKHRHVPLLLDLVDHGRGRGLHRRLEIRCPSKQLQVLSSAGNERQPDRQAFRLGQRQCNLRQPAQPGDAGQLQDPGARHFNFLAGQPDHRGSARRCREDEHAFASEKRLKPGSNRLLPLARFPVRSLGNRGGPGKSFGDAGTESGMLRRDPCAMGRPYFVPLNRAENAGPRREFPVRQLDGFERSKRSE
uniref:Predicted protein n=1 Tax=Physcomitrium patens TaxID=3218 RepID=A9U7Q4_PHYPA